MRKIAYWQLLLLLLSAFWGNALRAQSLYEITFKAADVNYTGFLVYFNEQDAYMRIAYTYENKYNVVNVNYHSVTGQSDGYNYFIMLGADPTFITENKQGNSYNPDHFIWVWNDTEHADLPYVTDDPDFNEEHMILCTSYKELDAKVLTDTYLRQFFASNEQQYIALRKMQMAATGQNQQANNQQSQQNQQANGNAKMHLILCVNTDIADIGQSCAVDQRAMELEFREISKAIGIPFEQHIINGQKFTKENTEQTIANLKVGKNDIVVFYYSGHGFRWSNQSDQYPQLDMRYSDYTPLSEKTALPLSAVYNSIVAKGGRLNVVMSDCCNSDIGRNQITSHTFMAGRSFQGAEIDKLRKLFLNSSGNLIFTGSSPGEYAWCNVNGGFFTLSFIQALKEEVGYMRSEAPNWNHLIQQTLRSTQYKSKSCNGCKPQNPVFSSKIAQR